MVDLSANSTSTQIFYSQLLLNNTGSSSSADYILSFSIICTDTIYCPWGLGLREYDNKIGQDF